MRSIQLLRIQDTLIFEMSFFIFEMFEKIMMFNSITQNCSTLDYINYIVKTIFQKHI